MHDWCKRTNAYFVKGIKDLVNQKEESLKYS